MWSSVKYAVNTWPVSAPNAFKIPTGFPRHDARSKAQILIPKHAHSPLNQQVRLSEIIVYLVVFRHLLRDFLSVISAAPTMFVLSLRILESRSV